MLNMSRTIIYRLWIMTIVLSLFSGAAVAQNIQRDAQDRALAKLDQQTIRIGDQVKLRLSVIQEPGQQYNFPILNDTLAGKLQVVSSSGLDTLKNKEDQRMITISKTYVITGFDPGKYTIPSFDIKSETKSVASPELSLLVQSVKVDTTKAMFDIKKPLAVSYTFGDWLKDNWIWVLFGLAVLVVLGVAIYYFRKRSKEVPSIPAPAPHVPAHILALQRLSTLREQQLWQAGQVKEYYSELSDVLREYAEKRFGITTYEKTTEEIFVALRLADLHEDDRKSLRDLLQAADMVKFAKAKPGPAENESNLEEALRFVSATQETVRIQPAEGGKDV